MKINLTDPDLYSQGDPHAVWRWLREHDPVHWHPPSGDFPGFWVLTKYDDVRAVYHDPDALALTDPPHHRKLRELVDDWFAPRSVRLLGAQLRDIARDVVTRALERGKCDFVAEIAARVPLYVIFTMLGVPRNDWERLFSLTNDAFGTDDPPERREAHLDILQYFEDLATARAKSPADDLVSVLATAKIDGRKLTEDEPVARTVNGAGPAPFRGRGGTSLDVDRHPYHAHRDRAGAYSMTRIAFQCAGSRIGISLWVPANISALAERLPVKLTPDDKDRKILS